jgi:hypothetical protein
LTYLGESVQSVCPDVLEIVMSEFICASCGKTKDASELPMWQRKILGSSRSAPRCYDCKKATSRSRALRDGIKTCAKCKETKPISEFSPGSGPAERYIASRCKACVAKNTARIKDAEWLEKPIFFCVRCQQFKPREEFSGSRKKKEYRCKECNARRAREGRYTVGYNFNSCKCSARSRGIPWELTKEQYTELRQRYLCHYCGGFITSSGFGIDRCDSNVGYTIDNVVPCCLECNLVKGCLFTKEEMELILGPAIAAVMERRTYLDNPHVRGRGWGRPRKYQT